MSPRPKRSICPVCQLQTSKYTCASCQSDYCSVACYKRHKDTCSTSTVSTTDTDTDTVAPATQPPPTDSNPVPESGEFEDTRPSPEPLQDPTPLRPLTSLQWPYVPDTSAYPDPLTRDDPKPLQLHQYESIATSPRIRTLLANSHLCTLLASIDALRGTERDEALQRALGLDSRRLTNRDDRHHAGHGLDEDTRALRELAETVEVAVRGGREDMLGLDWD